MTQRFRQTLTTGSAMFGLWERRCFESVVDYDSWSDELLDDEDIERHTAAGHFVPITNYSDGAFEFEVRIGTSSEQCAINERERTYATESSEPYLFRSEGELNISGIEFVGATLASDVGHLNIPAGDYTVTVYQIAWADEPGATDDEGNPTDETLPDFLVVVNPT
jgi:hypothetical protein